MGAFSFVLHPASDETAQRRALMAAEESIDSTQSQVRPPMHLPVIFLSTIVEMNGGVGYHEP